MSGRQAVYALYDSWEKRHLRPLVWRETSRVYQYKDYEINDIVAVFGQHSAVPIKLTEANREQQDGRRSCKLQDGREALEAAKERARGKALN